MLEITYTEKDWAELTELCACNASDWAVMEIKFEGQVMAVEVFVLWLRIVERIRGGEVFGGRDDKQPKVDGSASRAEWSASE